MSSCLNRLTANAPAHSCAAAKRTLPACCRGWVGAGRGAGAGKSPEPKRIDRRRHNAIHCVVLHPRRNRRYFMY